MGLLVDRQRFPLEINEFKGNLSETKTMIPVINESYQRHQLDTNQLTITADTGMLSTANLEELETAGFSFIVGSRIAKTPYQIKDYQKLNPQEQFIDGQIFETKQNFGYRREDKVKRRVIYQYRQKRASLDLANIDRQVIKAKRIINGQAPLKKMAFLSLATAKPQLNQELIREHQLRAGIKGYVTNLPPPKKNSLGGVLAQEVISNYHLLFQLEKSFRMSKSDLKARPIFHSKLDSTRAHLTIVFVALALARFIEGQTHLSIKKIIQKLRTVHSEGGQD